MGSVWALVTRVANTYVEKSMVCFFFGWPCISVYLSRYLTNLMHKIRGFTISFISCLFNVLSTCAHHQEVKIALHSLWYHHTYRWPSRARVERGPGHETATCRCDDTRGCVMQFWPDDEHMWRHEIKLTVKPILCIKLVKYWDKYTVCILYCPLKFWCSQ